MSWELSKENIQPIPQGRKMVCLEGALKNDNRNPLATRRHEFEIEIRAYDGPDPLDVWYRYACWVQQNYPSNGKESGLIDVCKKAVLNFHKEEKYKNDERYVHIWIIYANMCSDQANEMYNLMYQEKIGTDLAMFYKSWAWQVECQGNSKKANSIIVEGLNKNAQPTEDLQSYHKCFQERVMKKIHEGIENADMPSQPELQRKAFSELKTHGKKNLAPVSRIGGALNASTKPLSMSSKPSNPGSHNSKTTQIYVDENDDRNSQLIQKHNVGRNMSSIIGSTEVSNENKKKPGPWNKVKLKTKSTMIKNHEPVSSANSVNIYEEPDDTKEQSNKKNLPSFTTALSEIKDKKPLPYIIEPFDPSKKPMYDKWKVYGGPEEMSFEEIRAIKYIQKFKKKAEMDLKEKLMLKEAELEQKNQLINRLMSNNVSLDDGAMDVDASQRKENIIDGSLQSANKLQERSKNNAMETENESFEFIKPSMVYEENILPSVEECFDENIPGVFIHKDEEEEPMDALQSSFSEVKIQDQSHVKSNDSILPPRSDSGCSSHNTEMSMIRELWNGSLGEKLSCDNTMDDDVTFLNKKPFGSPDRGMKLPALQSKIPIFADDEDDVMVPETFANKENIDPKGEIKKIPPIRNMSGVLQPSTDFPVEEVEENQESHPEQQGLCFNVTNEPVAPEMNIMMNESHPCTLTSTRLEPNDGLSTENFKAPVELSIIMESSREYCSKSSISSSSNSTGHSFANSRVLCHSESNLSPIKDVSINQTKSLPLSSNGYVDPFANDVIDYLLEKVHPPLSNRFGFRRIDSLLPISSQLTSSTVPALGNFKILKSIAQGAYAEIFLTHLKNKDINVVMKVQFPSCYWEFYICSEIIERLNRKHVEDIKCSFPIINDAAFFNNGSLLVMDYQPYGTLLDLVNLYRSTGMTLPITLTSFFAIQLLYILENLHSCEIIHADLKPDNVMMLSIIDPNDINPQMFEGNRKLHLRLIDFGRSIDTSLLPKDTKFNQMVTTDGFQCPEMRENKPWTYQIDLYGFLVILNIFLFGEYMEINNKSGKWSQNNKLKRYWMGCSTFEEIFKSFLNIPDCDSIPDIKSFRVKLEQVLLQKSNFGKLQQDVTHFNTLFASLKR